MVTDRDRLHSRCIGGLIGGYKNNNHLGVPTLCICNAHCAYCVIHYNNMTFCVLARVINASGTHTTIATRPRRHKTDTVHDGLESPTAFPVKNLFQTAYRCMTVLLRPYWSTTNSHFVAVHSAQKTMESRPVRRSGCGGKKGNE
jgi:hypothetical protein